MIIFLVVSGKNTMTAFVFSKSEKATIWIRSEYHQKNKNRYGHTTGDSNVAHTTWNLFSSDLGRMEPLHHPMFAVKNKRPDATREIAME